MTPVGVSRPHSSAASRPTFDGLAACTPTSSRVGFSMIARREWTPTLPVENWITRRVMAAHPARSAAGPAGLTPSGGSVTRARVRDKTASPDGSSQVEPMTKKRAIGVWALIVVAALLLFTTTASVWVKRQALDTDNWVNGRRRGAGRPGHPGRAVDLHRRPALRQRRRAGVLRREAPRRPVGPGRPALGRPARAGHRRRREADRHAPVPEALEQRQPGRPREARGHPGGQGQLRLDHRRHRHPRARQAGHGPR